MTFHLAGDRVTHEFQVGDFVIGTHTVRMDKFKWMIRELEVREIDGARIAFVVTEDPTLTSYYNCAFLEFAE